MRHNHSQFIIDPISVTFRLIKARPGHDECPGGVSARRPGPPSPGQPRNESTVCVCARQLRTGRTVTGIRQGAALGPLQYVARRSSAVTRLHPGAGSTADRSVWPVIYLPIYDYSALMPAEVRAGTVWCARAVRRRLRSSRYTAVYRPTERPTLRQSPPRQSVP